MTSIVHRIAPNFLETVGTNGTSTLKGLTGSVLATCLIQLFHPAGQVVNPIPRGCDNRCGHRRGKTRQMWTAQACGVIG